jgi:hypothetical protein
MPMGKKRKLKMLQDVLTTYGTLEFFDIEVQLQDALKIERVRNKPYVCQMIGLTRECAYLQSGDEYESKVKKLIHGINAIRMMNQETYH